MNKHEVDMKFKWTTLDAVNTDLDKYPAIKGRKQIIGERLTQEEFSEIVGKVSRPRKPESSSVPEKSETKPSNSSRNRS